MTKLFSDCHKKYFEAWNPTIKNSYARDREPSFLSERKKRTVTEKYHRLPPRKALT